MNHTVEHKLTRKDAGNCWVYGCATVVVVGILGIIFLVFGVKYAFNKMVEKYTDETPIELPTVESTEEERTSTIGKFDSWMQTLESGDDAGTLELTQKDVNVLIQHHPSFTDISEIAYVTIDGSEIKGEMSVPLDAFATELGWDSLKGRYFNGSLSLEVIFEDEYLEVYMTGGSLNGEEIPQNEISAISGQNLAQDANSDPELRETFRQIESIVIEDGKLIITPKVGEGAVHQQAPEAGDAPVAVEVPEAVEVPNDL